MKYTWLIYAVVGGAVTALLHFIAHFPWLLAALAAFVGWPLIGTLVTFDDDLPGGWSNPDGTQTPEWRTAPFWGRIVLGLAIAGAFGAFEWALSHPRALGSVLPHWVVSVSQCTFFAQPGGVAHNLRIEPMTSSAVPFILNSGGDDALLVTAHHHRRAILGHA
jgi:hypothetical protein